MSALRGDIPFEAAGETYTLKFGINEMCALEEQLDMPVGQIGAELQRSGLRLTFLRSMFQIGLTGHHPELTTTDVGQLMEELTLPVVGEKVLAAFAAAFPKAEDAKAPARPRKAKPPGTGRRSSQPGAS